MGSAFSLGVMTENESDAKELLDMGVREIKRLETIISEFIPESEVSVINRDAHRDWVKVGKETFGLLKRSLAISQLTQGDFDITVKPLKSCYDFKRKQVEFPAKSKIDEAMKAIGYELIQLNEKDQSVSLQHAETKVSFAGIGKGYAADCVKNLWLKNGVDSGYINASGDLCAFGNKPDGSPWSVGIGNPLNPEKMIFHIPASNRSVATSGDYEQFFMYRGERYSHTIDPKTGMPVKGTKSVSVVSPSAELSDALATAIFVKGPKNGLAFVNQLPETHCIIIDDKNRSYFSKKMTYEAQVD